MGILIVVFILLLFGVDITCYFLNKCGLLMCIAVNFCGKSGPSAKGKDIEEGKAAFTWACLFLSLSSVCVPLSDNAIYHGSPIIIAPISSTGGLVAGLIVTYLSLWMRMMWILAHGGRVEIRGEEERCMLVRNEKAAWLHVFEIALLESYPCFDVILLHWRDLQYSFHKYDKYKNIVLKTATIIYHISF